MYLVTTGTAPRDIRVMISVTLVHIYIVQVNHCFLCGLFDTMADYSCKHIIRGFQESISCIKISPCGSCVGIGTEDGTLKLVHVDSGRVLQQTSSREAVTTLMWHPLKGLTLFVGYANGRLCLISVSV